MSQSGVAKRYALALFQLAQEQTQLANVEEDVRELKQVFIENPELNQVFTSPKLTVERKKDLLRELFVQANPLVVNTLLVLLDAKRLNEVINVVDEFIILLNDASGVADAKVYSTRLLTDKEITLISTTFAKKINKQTLRIENEIDPTLIGGLRIQIGNRIYDNSISSKLEKLQRQLIG